MVKLHKFILGFIVIILSVGIPHQGYARSLPRNGALREFYPSGQIRIEFRYKRGLLVRKKAWYQDGHLLLDYRYKNGEPILKKDYYENGRLKSIWVRKTGILKFYHADGKLKAVVDSRSDGLYH